MKRLLFIGLKPRHLLALLFGFIMIIGGMLLDGKQGISWAAPGHHPNQQSIPPRPTDPPPPPPDPAPEATADPDQSSDLDSPTESSAPTSVSQPTNEDFPTETSDPTPVSQPADQDSPTDPLTQPAEDSGEVPPSARTTEQEEQEVGTSQTGSQPAQPSKPDYSEDRAPDSLQTADLSLSKSVNNPTPLVGEVITLTTVVSNNGPGQAARIAVSDPLPPGLNQVLAVSTHGFYDAETGLWTVYALTPGQSVTLSLAALAANTGVVTNTAEIAASSLFDPDSTPGNGIEPEDDQDSVPIVVSLEPSASVQSANNNQGAHNLTSASVSEVSTLLGEAIWLNWLYALFLGLILILLGLFLVNRS